MDSKRPATYTLISDEQKAQLLQYYNLGMKSTLDTEKINDAVRDTGLPVEKVKVVKLNLCKLISV